MFKLFNKNKEEYNKENVIEYKENNNVKNYKVKPDGNIEIKIRDNDFPSWYSIPTSITIEKSSIISHTKNSIIYKDYVVYYNFQNCERSPFGSHMVTSAAPEKSIERKNNLIKYRKMVINTYVYLSRKKFWNVIGIDNDNVGEEVLLEKTPLEVFKENYNSKYKLIETEDEFNEYMNSTLDCDTWCRKKLYNKMKELGLGDGFINQFADLVGDSLDKYHAMIDLANEVSDKDTLMYLYTYKFRR